MQAATKAPKPSPAEAKIRVFGAHKAFRQANGGQVDAISDLSFDVADGEYVAVVGPTGAGKSVLLDCILGLKRLDAGHIVIDGEDVGRYAETHKGKITRIFQEDRLLPWLSATDNVALGLQIQGIPLNERRERAVRWLEAVGLGRFRNAFPSELSGGMRQRVNIARAFATEPEIILLDEAFSALDEITAERLRGDFAKLAHQQKMTFLIVTHSIEEAIFLAGRILIFGVPARVVQEIVVPASASTDRSSVDRIRDEVRNWIASGAFRD